MDSKDELIIEQLNVNSRLTTKEIAKKTKLPITTVHNRIKKLQEDGIIKKFSLVLDQKKLGKLISAFVLITVDYKLLKEKNMSQQDVVKLLIKNPDVEEAAMITGAADILIKARFAGIDEMDAFVTKYLRNIDGIDKTQTMIILNEQ